MKPGSNPLSRHDIDNMFIFFILFFMHLYTPHIDLLLYFFIFIFSHGFFSYIDFYIVYIRVFLTLGIFISVFHLVPDNLFIPPFSIVGISHFRIFA